MGMFDYVNYECVCPVCKNKVDGFQSKDGECILDLIEPQDVNTFYTTCDTCGVWLDFMDAGMGTYALTVEGQKGQIMSEHSKRIKIK